MNAITVDKSNNILVPAVADNFVELCLISPMKTI